MKSFKISLFLFFTFAIQAVYSSISGVDSLIIVAVQTGDGPAVAECLEKGSDINAIIGEDEFTLLAYSIVEGQTDMTGFLIQNGADVEKSSDRKTPLMFAAKYNRPEVVPLLIDGGADINSVNTYKNTALHYAAKYGRIEMVNALVENGALLNQMNKDDWTALDFAIIGRRKGIEDYLTSHGGMIFPKRLPSFLDGPYMEFTRADQLKVFYLSHDSIENKSRIISSFHSFNSSSCTITGVDGDETIYTIRKDSDAPPSVYDDVPRILAVGDIHGQYSRMTGILKKAGVIDEDLQWQWGSGHLVFTGDIFDRGNQVTQCLWFIYDLEKQAGQHNGKVHLLLGNHEFMVLNNDIRYISNRYYGITGNLEFDYADLYNRNTILGQWLRTKNTIEKINDLIFVHAGISQEFESRNLSIDSTNNVMRSYLNRESNSNSSELHKFLLGNQGPVWYRGYLNGSRNAAKMTAGEVCFIGLRG